jgi:hypothetical protein
MTVIISSHKSTVAMMNSIHTLLSENHPCTSFMASLRSGYHASTNRRHYHETPLRNILLNTRIGWVQVAAAGWRTEKGRDFVNPAQSLRIRLTSEVRKRNATPREAKIVPT